MLRTLSVLCVLALCAFGCDDDDATGGDDMGVAGAGGGGEGGAGGEGGGATAWADLDFQGRQAYMAQTVMPTMQPLFAAYDAQYADNFTCGTCHGSDLTEFSMPADIPGLSGAELSTFTFETEGHQDIANAMASQIVPKMAELLGQEPFNPQTDMGTFGCFSCHAIQ